MGPDTTTCMKNFKTDVDTYKDKVKEYNKQSLKLKDCQTKIVNFNACTKSYQIYLNNCNAKLVKCGYTPVAMFPQGEFYIQEEDCGGCSGNTNFVDYTEIEDALLKRQDMEDYTADENDMVFSLAGNPCNGPFNVGFISIDWEQAYDDAVVDIRLAEQKGEKDAATLKICNRYKQGQTPFVRVIVIRKGAPFPIRQVPPKISVPICPPPIDPKVDKFEHGQGLALYLKAIIQVIDNIKSQIITCDANLLLAQAGFIVIRNKYCNCTAILKEKIDTAPPNSECKKIIFSSDTDIACEKLVNVGTKNNPCANK